MNNQWKNHLVGELYPDLGKGMRKRVVKLMEQKKAVWLHPDLKPMLDNIVGSVVRHNATEYDSIVPVVGKRNARFYVQSEVKEYLGGSR